MRKLSGLLILFILGACATYSDEELKSFDNKIKSYLKKKDIICEKSSSGLYYKIIEEGEGDYIQYKDHVHFKYKGEFIDGKVFDEQKDPVEFDVSTLIAGWKEIMLELKPGGKAYLVVPPHLGYGTKNLDDIPKNSILVYELEVVEVI